MSQLTNRSNVAAHIEQRILNTFPPTSRARLERYSNYAQFVHPYGVFIQEAAIANERAWAGFFHQIMDYSDMDTLYTVPIYDVTWDTLVGITEQTSTVSLTETPATLDAFWYGQLPTRMDWQKQSYKWEYPTTTASNLKFGSLYQCYSLGTHAEQHSVLDSSSGTADWAFVAPGGTFSSNASSGWGDGYFLGIHSTDIVAATTTAYWTSAALATATQLLFHCEIKSSNYPLSTFDMEIGWLGVQTASKTGITMDSSWNRESIVFEKTATHTAGTAFVRLEFPTNNAAFQVDLSDYYLMDLSVIDNTNTSYPVRSLYETDPSWAYVVVSGGSGLINVATSVRREQRPATVMIEGINAHGQIDREEIDIMHNGTHRSSKTWIDVTGTRVENMYPWSASVQVKLHNYQSTSAVPDFLDLYVDVQHTSHLFYSLTTANGTSMLGYQAYDVSEISDMVDGYDGVSNYYYIELLDHSTNSFSITDMTFDHWNRWIYALDPGENRIHVYDPSPYWPGTAALSNFVQRTPAPDMVIRDLEFKYKYATSGSVIPLMAYWRSRLRRLKRNRWTLVKPGGTSVGLTLAGAEVAATSDYWITNLDDIDPLNQEFRFHPQDVYYTATGYGDYAVILECEFLDEDNDQISYQRDVTVFSVPSKTPLTSIIYTASTSSSLGAAAGIDIDPYGNVRLGYQDTANSNLWIEEVYRPRYDYYMRDNDRKIAYLREPYATARWST